MSFLQVADIMAPSVALGLLFTRVGCFLSGCCYGKPTTLALGVSFPLDSPAGQSAASAARELGLATITLHPAQLYASAYGLGIFVLLIVFQKHLMKRGATFGALLILYGIARFVVDFFRFYEENARVLLGLTFNQIISVALLVLGVYLVARRPVGKKITREP